MTVTCSVCILLLPETRDTALEDALPPRPNKAFCVCCPSSPPEEMDEPSEPLRKKDVLVPGDIEMTKHMSNNHCTDVWYESFNTYCRAWIYTAQNMIRTLGYTFTSDTTCSQVTWIFPGAPLTFNGAPWNIQDNLERYRCETDPDMIQGRLWHVIVRKILRHSYPLSREKSLP